MNILRGAIMATLMLAAQAMALDKVPAVMVSTSTNTYNVLTGKTAQADFDFIDDWLVAESNRLTAVSNLAQSAYNLASTNSGTGAQRTYSYANTGTLTVASANAGETWFYASTQSIGQLHAGQAITGALFNAGTTNVIVDYETRKVTISLVCAGTGSGQASYWGSGTYTHIVPTNWTRCKITVTGGGDSGGADAASQGGGGGAGGTSIGYWALRAGDSWTVTVGSGGTNVTANSSGVAGGTSSFGALQSSTGGNGEGAAIDGLGGLGSGGILNLRGSYGIAGHGGITIWGGNGGSGSMGLATNAVGYGAGGGGSVNAVGARSGRGQFGVVVVEYF